MTGQPGSDSGAGKLAAIAGRRDLNPPKVVAPLSHRKNVNTIAVSVNRNLFQQALLGWIAGEEFER